MAGHHEQKPGLFFEIFEAPVHVEAHSHIGEASSQVVAGVGLVGSFEMHTHEKLLAVRVAKLGAVLYVAKVVGQIIGNGCNNAHLIGAGNPQDVR